MGWASGSMLLSIIIETLKTHVDADTRAAIYPELVEAFEDADCDTLDECMTIDPVFDEYLKNNGWDELFEDEDE